MKGRCSNYVVNSLREICFMILTSRIDFTIDLLNTGNVQLSQYLSLMNILSYSKVKMKRINIVHFRLQDYH